MPASLTIAGLGPGGPGQVTLEAAEVLKRAEREGHWAGGLTHARELAAAIAPGLAVERLEYFYLLDVPRPVVYRLIADLVLGQCQVHGREALFLVEGSPLVLNEPVRLLRQACAAQGYPLRLVHGMSFVEVVLERVFWSSPNLQFYSARGLALGHEPVHTGAPALLYQLGEHSGSTDVLDTRRSVDLLAALRDRLLKHYPPSHPVIVLYSDDAPSYASRARQVPLMALASEPVPIYSNLWLPAIDGPDDENQLAPD